MKEEINSRWVAAFNHCKDKGLIKSNVSAAKVLGVRPQLLSEILGKRVNASTELIHKICTNYAVSLDYIFFNKKPILKQTEELELNNSESGLEDVFKRLDALEQKVFKNKN